MGCELYLKSREREIVRLLGAGHSVGSAAAALEMGVQVAKNHLQRARDRNRMNSYELVARVAVEEDRMRRTKRAMGGEQ